MVSVTGSYAEGRKFDSRIRHDPPPPTKKGGGGAGRGEELTYYNACSGGGGWCGYDAYFRFLTSQPRQLLCFAERGDTAVATGNTLLHVTAQYLYRMAFE